MHYWFRPPIHLCDSPHAEQALCGTQITGIAPTVRPLPRETDPADYLADRDADVCENCERVYAATEQ